MNSDLVDINTGGQGFITTEVDDESWELLKREFNTLFSNLRKENNAENKPTNDERKSARRPINLEDHDDSRLLNHRKNGIVISATHNRFERSSDSRDMRTCDSKRIRLAQFIFNTLEGKEVCLKIFQHTLELLSLLLCKAKIRIPSKVHLVILQLSIFRYLLRFGNLTVNLFQIAKKFRQYREMRKSHLQEKPICFYSKGFQFSNIVEAFYNLTDELILLHKLKSVFSGKNISSINAGKFTRFIKQQHNILWEILNIIAMNKNIFQWRQLMKEEIYLNLFNINDNAAKEHKSEYKVLANNKINLKLQKNISTFDFYKIILNLLSNLINIKNKRKEFNSCLTYEIITMGSCFAELVRLWNQARLALAEEYASAT